jgi:hypothetical protein
VAVVSRNSTDTARSAVASFVLKKHSNSVFIIVCVNDRSPPVNTATAASNEFECEF